MKPHVALIALLALGAAAWLLLGDASAPPEDPLHALSPERGGSLGAEPFAPQAPGEARELDTTDLPPAPGADGAPFGDASPWPAPLEVMTANGHVLDEFGAPVPGALVMLVVDIRTASQLDRERGYTPYALDPSTLPSAITAHDGGFELRGPWLPDDGVHSEFPSLVVSAPGYALHHFECTGFAGGEFAASELVLRVSGSELRARLVDPSGAPLVGVGAFFMRLDWSDFPAGRDNVHRFDNSATHLASLSDAKGELRIEQLWPVKLSLYFQFPEERWEHFGEIDLRDGFLDLGTLVLDPDKGPRITGLVRGADGEPLAGAFVQIKGYDAWQRPAPAPPGSDVAGAWLRSPESRGVTTDADGRYELRDLDDDWAEHVVAISAAGHDPAVLLDVPFDSEAPEVTLQPQASLTVSVRAARDGRALPEAELRAVRVTGTWEAAVGGTRARDVELRVEGERVLQVGPFGTRLYASAPGFSARVVEVDGVPPGDTRHVDVALDPAVTLSVRVRDDRGEPVAGASVALSAPAAWGPRFRDLDLGSQLQGLTDADGLTRHSGLAPGDWELRVGTQEHWSVSRVPCSLGAEDTEIEVVLQRRSVLLGELLDAAGAPVVGREVLIGHARGETAWDADWHSEPVRTDVNGRFAHRTLPAGEVRVLAPGTELLVLNLAVGEVHELALRQHAPFRLEGRVTSGGEPVAGIDVTYSGPTGGARPMNWSGITQTDELGAYSADVGTYGGLSVKARPEHGVELSAHLESSPGGHATQDFDLGSASLGGVVLLPDGAPDLEGVSAYLNPVNGRSVRLPLGADGRFRFAPLPPDSYRLSVSAAGMLPLSAGPFELAAGEQRDDLELRLQPGGSVTGSIVWASGEPFSGTLSVTRGGDGGLSAATSVHAGTFSLPELSAGNWELSATALDMMESFNVEPGDWLSPAPQRFTLDAGGELELELVVPGAPP